MDNVLDRLSLAVKDARSHANMTQQELARKLKISRHHLARIENRREKPSYDLLCLLISELDLPAQMIMHPKVSLYKSEVEKISFVLQGCDKHELLVFSEMLHMVIQYKAQLLPL